MEDHRFTVRLGLGALVITTAVGCAQQRDPINRVGANALSKEFFVGADLSSPADDPEFYASSTVVDVPANVTASLFTGSSGELRRIKWEISEKVLNARLTYENIQNLDGKGARETNNGAGHRVVRHREPLRRQARVQPADGRRAQHRQSKTRPTALGTSASTCASTGRRTRSSSAYTFDPLASFKADGQTLEPLAYRVDNPSDPDAPVFERRTAISTSPTRSTSSRQHVSGSSRASSTAPSSSAAPTPTAGATRPKSRCACRSCASRSPAIRLPRLRAEEWDGARLQRPRRVHRDRLGYDRHYGIIDRSGTA